MVSVQELFNRAAQKHVKGDLHGAEAICRRLLNMRPAHADALHMLGMILSQTGRFEEGIGLLQQATRLQPANAVVHHNLGEAYRRHGDDQRATACFRRAISADPRFPEAHFSLGNMLKAAGQHEEAMACYRRALELRPGHVKARFNLANALREQGLLKKAVVEYQAVIAAEPEWADPYMNLGNAYSDLGQSDEALACYQKAARLAPDRADLQVSLGHVYRTQGRMALARGCYQQAADRNKGRWLDQLRWQTLCEVIPPSVAYIDEYREQLMATLRRYAGEERPVEVKELHQHGVEPPMSLTYHGRDDLPLKRGYANLFADRIRALDLKRAPGKPHVGFVVTHGHEGVFWKCLGGIVNGLSGRSLRISLICSRSGANILRQWVRNPAVEYLVLPETIDEAAECIRAAGVHLLHYWEIGTDCVNYFLPYLKPAPVQCATWGWPSTSGIPSVDYYVSSQVLEPEKGDAHYSERLVRLKSLPSCYSRPAIASSLKDREHFGLGRGDHVYLCQQNLRKCQPDFDAVLGGILEADAQATVLLIADAQPAITQLLVDRLGRSLGAKVSRVRIVPRLPDAEYMNLLALADVALDTLYYGAGANTVYDALAAGTPMVPFRGAFHRGRWSAAAYRELGLEHVVVESADAYVRKTAQLATDADYRGEVGERLLSAGEALFESRAAVTELEEFFLQSIAGATK